MLKQNFFLAFHKLSQQVANGILYDCSLKHMTTNLIRISLLRNQGVIIYSSLTILIIVIAFNCKLLIKHSHYFITEHQFLLTKKLTSCYVTGLVERQQLLTYFNASRQACVTTTNITVHDFDVQVVSVDCEVHIVVQDNRHTTCQHTATAIRSKPTRGGANFHIVATGTHHLFTCPYTDNFNTTYVIKCPLYEKTTLINVELQHADFEAFRLDGVKRSLTLWNITVVAPVTCSLFVPAYVGWYRANTTSA